MSRMKIATVTLLATPPTIPHLDNNASANINPSGAAVDVNGFIKVSVVTHNSNEGAVNPRKCYCLYILQIPTFNELLGIIQCTSHVALFACAAVLVQSAPFPNAVATNYHCTRGLQGGKTFQCEARSNAAFDQKVALEIDEASIATFDGSGENEKMTLFLSNGDAAYDDNDEAYNITFDDRSGSGFHNAFIKNVIVPSIEDPRESTITSEDSVDNDDNDTVRWINSNGDKYRVSKPSQSLVNQENLCAWSGNRGKAFNCGRRPGDIISDTNFQVPQQ
ncbi:hypothetical protein BU17DRAFT_66361 [Hysterangium stoloniferum]|nr:hypothetical protein BU17DRAFT_66361 [Hysterangium stoloniferum]